MIFLFGANALALSISTELENAGEQYEILIDKEYFSTDRYEGLKVSISQKINFRSGDKIINCIGYGNMHARQNISNRYKSLGILTSYISPKATVGPKVHIGIGTVILGGSYIERGSKVGDGCILWHRSHVCHDAEIGSFSFLAAGSIIGGYSKIPCFSKLGFNSVIQEKSDLSMNSPINPGALAFVKRDGSINAMKK